LTFFTSLRTEWAKLNDAHYHRRPSGPLLKHERVQRSKQWWTRSPDQILTR